MTKFRTLSALLLIVSLIFPDIASSQGFDSLLANESRKRIDIRKTQLVAEIDGVLDDEVWQQATVITDMHQYQPVDHGTPSEKSEFYITYNDQYFYIAAKLYHKDPSQISARQLIQGQGLGFDDTFEFILDTFNNGRTGYNFQVNPNGIRREGLYEGPFSLNRDWEGIWLVESRIVEDGWIAEVAVPFNTLNFNPNSDVWGFSIARTISHNREDVAWSSFNREVNPTTAGLMYGITDINQGLGLDIIPSVTLINQENYFTGDTESNFEPSLDVFYKFTPNLTGVLTLNTDFSATEVDNRQVNLSRFSLFFPEKRDFFLQDSDIFTFGGLGQGFGSGGSNGIPFYSRRIGLSPSGEPIDLDIGAKATGRVGNVNIGSLIVQQGDYTPAVGPTLDGQSAFVGRVAVNVLSQSTIGGIVTVGDPTSEIDNSLVGMDFNYQNTYFSETHSLSGNAWYQQTDTEGLSGDDKAFGVKVDLDTGQNGFGGGVGYQYFGEDFRPRLGFANRVGVESYEIGGSGRYFFNDNPLFRNVFTFGRYNYVKKLDTGEMDSESLFWRVFNLNTHIGDQIGIGVSRNRDAPTEPFFVGGVLIPAGKYSWSRVQVEGRLSNQRLFSPSLRLEKGGYYDGDTEQANVGLNWRPNSHIVFDMSYNYQYVDLPRGDFTVRLISANVNYAFNSKWSWVNLVQYDNFSDSVGINSRLRWNPRAGEDMFLVINYNLQGEGAFTGLNARTSEIILKYTKTFRY